MKFNLKEKFKNRWVIAIAAVLAVIIFIAYFKINYQKVEINYFYTGELLDDSGNIRLKEVIRKRLSLTGAIGCKVAIEKNNVTIKTYILKNDIERVLFVLGNKGGFYCRLLIENQKPAENSFKAYGLFDNRQYIVSLKNFGKASVFRNIKLSYDNSWNISFPIDKTDSEIFDFISDNVGKETVLMIGNRVYNTVIVKIRTPKEILIHNNFSQQQASNILIILRSGEMPVELNFVSNK